MIVRTLQQLLGKLRRLRESPASLTRIGFQPVETIAAGDQIARAHAQQLRNIRILVCEVLRESLDVPVVEAFVRPAQPPVERGVSSAPELSHCPVFQATQGIDAILVIVSEALFTQSAPDLSLRVGLL